MQRQSKLFMYLFILIPVILLSAVCIYAENPLVRHIYTADPAPIVHDGRFYVFTGHDEGGEGWTLKGWHVLSSEDMVNWTDHGEVLSCEDIDWLNENQAWASQCVERNGKFYFYICDYGEIGVAVADNILGPYRDALGYPLITSQTEGACPGNTNIDPAVFIDDDGQAYLYWGTQGSVRQAKLKDNMIEIEGEITVPQGIDRFFEASWVHKRDGIYYYSYAALNSNGEAWPSNIDYATSSDPLGPWTYRGTLNGFAGTGTNHSGIVSYKESWYFVYHTDYLSDGTPWERSVQVDYLYYNEDGTLQKIEQTTSGVEPVGDPPVRQERFYKIRAEHSGKLMEIADGSTSDNSNVQQSADNGEYYQHWEFNEVENGVYSIINRNSRLALDADMANDNVIQYGYWGGENQQWKLTGTGEGSFYIVNREANRVLDVYNAETDEGANIQHWEFNGEACQKWELIEVETTGIENYDGKIANCENSVIIKGDKITGRLKRSGIFSVYSLIGKKIYEKKVQEDFTFSLSRLSVKGMYIVVVKRNGKSVFETKVIYTKE